MKRAYLILCFYFVFFSLIAQETTFPVNGVDDYRNAVYAFKNATIFLDYKTKIENATLFIQQGKILAVGKEVAIPSGAIIKDLEGKYIYPSFIDLFSSYGIAKTKGGRNWDAAPKFVSDKKGAYGWNKAILPEIKAAEIFNQNATEAEALRKAGFGAVLTHRNDGIARGSGALVLLADKKENELILKDKAAAFYSFNKGSSDQDYPESQMGAIALLRQTYLDAQWYAKNKSKTEYNISLENWNTLQNIPSIFEVSDKQEALRAALIGKDFGVSYIIKGSGDEYQRIQEIKNTKLPFILPLNFPKAPDVSDPLDAQIVDYVDLKHWEMAPSNSVFLQKENIPFCFTVAGLEKTEEIFAALQKAVKRGLSDSAALKALTYNPAVFIHAENELGSLEKGKWANFIICEKSIFDEKNTLYQNWVKGIEYTIQPFKPKDISGQYTLAISNEKTLDAIITKDETPVLKIKIDTSEIKVPLKRTEQKIQFSFALAGKKSKSLARFSGVFLDKNASGQVELVDGKSTTWSLTYIKSVADSAKKDTAVVKKDTVENIGKTIYPFAAFGFDTIPTVKTVLIKNTTVWTSDKAGILQNTDVLLQDGKIKRIGKNIESKDAEIVDGKDKHLTPGIIDEHSHIAISKGVNEGTKTSSAEVRIGDVVDADDVDIYRQLAGGVTAAQLLHGSANPIGGQAAHIKLRYGFSPENMKIKNDAGFIKFALGENVKQSNWGDKQMVRFPQTRMGVEQVYLNYFTKAQEYEKNLKEKPTETRRDLELDALVEILNKKRFITCHSYVQSEINMLMHVADSFGFKVNTFTHILEGYKVADKMKNHGVYASTFSDWWAYKYEVIDAIPYNAAMLTKMGVATAINSDDAEMARRLNQEAAKTIKYGNMTEEEALKMVTINPAKMLHLDQFMGSVTEGKDADVVLWNANPLSIYAKPLQTYVDGIRFFDIQEDAKKREAMRIDRARIIQKLLEEKEGGAATSKVVPKSRVRWNCGEEEHHH